MQAGTTAAARGRVAHRYVAVDGGGHEGGLDAATHTKLIRLPELGRQSHAAEPTIHARAARDLRGLGTYSLAGGYALWFWSRVHQDGSFAGLDSWVLSLHSHCQLTSMMHHGLYSTCREISFTNFHGFGQTFGELIYA